MTDKPKDLSWNVVYLPALKLWVATVNPSNERLDALGVWIAAAEMGGPPGNSHKVSPEFYTVAIPGAAARANFFATPQDNWMRVKEFV